MAQQLDLSIMLTPPPQDSPSEVIASICLHCDPLGLTHTGDLLSDPLTEQNRKDVRWYLEEYWKWPYEGFRERSKRVEAFLPELGQRLYKGVFGSIDAMDILQAWWRMPATQRRISIESTVPRALSLPWELLHDEQGFLAVRTRTPISIVRCLPEREREMRLTPLKQSLRILLITARPDDTGLLDPHSIARELLDEVQEQVDKGMVAVELLRPPTLNALWARLKDPKRPPIDVLHFDGHGMFGEDFGKYNQHHLNDGKRGILAFEDNEGKLDLIETKEFANVLPESRIRLVVLTACQSALGMPDDAFSSVAIQLIQRGVDAVITLSVGMLSSTMRYIEAFYRTLAKGASTLNAHERARQVVYEDLRRPLPPRYQKEGAAVLLRDWWLPHYYQQSPLLFKPTSPTTMARTYKKPPVAKSLARLSESMPAEPRYGFSGRALELQQIERALLQKKLVVISGFGGLGKTALAREAADWFTRTELYDGACFISFEHGGDTSTLLSTLGSFLGIYDGHYNLNDPELALTQIKSAIKQQRTLAMVDNLESILPNGEASLEPAMRAQLWGVLLALRTMGVGILLTSRDTTFDDRRLAPGNKITYLLLKGLLPNDAYALASRLLNDLGIDRAHIPYVELCDLLDQLDYHPLAIQLVLPALRERTLAQVRADFAALLPTFADDTETGRNRSLMASLDYSLDRLGVEQSALLQPLAVFEGGASEDDLLAITEISEAVWATLRHALEQAALIRAEQVHETIRVPFLHFHPLLVPYLRGRAGPEDMALRHRYALRYYAVANYLYSQDAEHPKPVRALVQRELPNLRRALELLLQEGEVDTASDMADTIVRFLTIFGMIRERDQVRRRVIDAVGATRASTDGMLTHAEYLHEIGIAQDERIKGNLDAAFARLTALLRRIKAQPEAAQVGPGSYAHCRTLQELANCLSDTGQPALAENKFREALLLIDVLMRQDPGNQELVRQWGVLLIDLGHVLLIQGQYVQAQETYKQALRVAEQLGDLRNQAVGLGQLGTVALQQHDYVEARDRYAAALERFRYLGEPAGQAAAWHQLGIVSEKQEAWKEAEQYYRESLAISEQLGDATSVASTCNQLATLAVEAGRPSEAEGWYKRALEIYQTVSPESTLQASICNNLAHLLENEVWASRAPIERLAEARHYAERALAIKERLDASVEIWTTLHILAEIAELEGRTEAAREYRSREREAYAAFAGNRYYIDQQYGLLIAAIVAAAKGDKQAREIVDSSLSTLEANGWKIAAATQRIWAGERNWQSLVEDLDDQDALLIRRVLETLSQSVEASSLQTDESKLRQRIDAAIQEKVEGDDAITLQKSFEVTPSKEVKRLV